MSSPGRPRNEELTDRIRQAAVELLCERGYDGLSMEGVADRAGVGKPTVYRRWDSLEALVVDVVRQRTRELEVPDTGTLATDLRATVARWLTTMEQDARIISGLASALPRSPRLAELFRERVARPRLVEIQQIFDRAVERGECSPDVDTRLLSMVMPSAIVYRTLLLNEHQDMDRFAAAIVEQVLLPACSTRPSDVPASREHITI